MAKVSGSYERVTLGVSEQVPQERRSGQHFEQVNMISDPVRGLARRHGSLLQDEKVLRAYDPTTYANWLADTATHKVFSFFVAGVEYDLIARSDADNNGVGNSTFFAFNKDARIIIPVVIAGDAAALVSGGISAFVNVGKYIFIAGNTIVPQYTAVDAWAAANNTSRKVLWVRGGGYSRTMQAALITPTGTKLSVTITTKSSSYPYLLDTSDISATASDYQKQVNDRVNAYNGNVTKWIGDAAADITPISIATKFYNAFAAAGYPAGNMRLVDSTLCFYDFTYNEISCEDGGDGSLLRAVGATVSTVDGVSVIHTPGHIVKVKPKKNDESDTLYLQAVLKQTGGSPDYDEVTWKEVAGYQMTPVMPFCIGTVKNGTLYIAGTGATLTAQTGDATPIFKSNAVGDDLTSPLPYFMGKHIDYLGLFQDRLVIGCQAVQFFSRPGDYFNWFRQSVLATSDDDPVEIYALGSEDDTIVASAVFDKDLILFGKRKQYTVTGRQVLTPKSGVITPMSSYEDGVTAIPQASGNFVFYAKSRDNISSMHQIQIGQVLDSPSSFCISQQLDRYLQGNPVEIVATTAPNTVILRTDASRQTLYTYSYLDTANGAERQTDSWSRWTWAAGVGDVIGVSKHKSDILAYFLRHGLDKDGNAKIWFGCDRFVLDTGISALPYLDSLRITSSVITPAANAYINPRTELGNTIFSAYGNDGSANALLGTDLVNVSDFLAQYPTAVSGTWTGIGFDAFATPTNPYYRDRDGKAVVNGRLTFTKVAVSIADSGGLQIDVATPNRSYTTTNFTGRILARTSNRVGRAPIVTTAVSGLIGYEVRDCSYTLRAKTFLPLTVTAIEWTGQYFNNAPRV